MASHICSKCADSYESQYIDELCPACEAHQNGHRVPTTIDPVPGQWSLLSGRTIVTPEGKRFIVNRAVGPGGIFPSVEADEMAHRIVDMLADPLHEHAAALLNACLHMIDIVEDYERAHGIAGIDASLLHDAKIATLNAQGLREEGYNDHTCDALCNSKSGCPNA